MLRRKPSSAAGANADNSAATADAANKRVRVDGDADVASAIVPAAESAHVVAQFVAEDGSTTGPPLDLPLNVTPDQLRILLNSLLKAEDDTPYSFFVNEEEVTETVHSAFAKQGLSSEVALQILYVPQAVFRVRAVTRCTSSMPGHSDSVTTVAFSPDGTRLASGSGDTTVRFWDVRTQTPEHTCTGHKHWVLAIAWSPDGKHVATADKNSQIYVWDAENGKAKCGPMTGHSSWVNWISWEPVHLNPECRRFATASKDGTVKIWDILQKRCLMTFAQHTNSVTCVKWGGEGLIYTASQDRTIKVWRVADGVMCRSLTGHAHWVNVMALSTDYVLRTGAFDHTGRAPATPEEAKTRALERYNAALAGGRERLVSGSDDFTMFLWDPSESKQPITRMTGHQQVVNHLSFSPDGRYITSASFDKSVKLWDGRTGKFICTFRGHVGPVYQVAWSADSRLCVSASKDSTMKVWDMASKHLKFDLPGHADEVFAVDWSPDGESVASGSRDTMVKIWRS
ncbi:NLE1 protein [Capsaspora owczarzaki ATCC 30864]|uniref:NLE1 protein n=1 Tax=Capsaspora owczarzaki (strain ATCC 30864) TaxID=595528 RepID=A0A0D2UCB8_CAPO3|nr:NLE1 protein [Capsaspora owczarzaki ATCC 30864]